MNRRAVFVSGGSAAALVATGGLGTSRKAFGQSPSPYNSSSVAAAITTGKTLNGTATGSDWAMLQNSLVGCYND